jgi:hypothetical protein
MHGWKKRKTSVSPSRDAIALNYRVPLGIDLPRQVHQSSGWDKLTMSSSMYVSCQNTICTIW